MTLPFAMATGGGGIFSNWPLFAFEDKEEALSACPSGTKRWAKNRGARSVGTARQQVRTTMSEKNENDEPKLLLDEDSPGSLDRAAMLYSSMTDLRGFAISANGTSMGVGGLGPHERLSGPQPRDPESSPESLARMQAMLAKLDDGSRGSSGERVLRADDEEPPPPSGIALSLHQNPSIPSQRIVDERHLRRTRTRYWIAASALCAAALGFGTFSVLSERAEVSTRRAGPNVADVPASSVPPGPTNAADSPPPRSASSMTAAAARPGVLGHDQAPAPSSNTHAIVRSTPTTTKGPLPQPGLHEHYVPEFSSTPHEPKP